MLVVLGEEMAEGAHALQCCKVLRDESGSGSGSGRRKTDGKGKGKGEGEGGPGRESGGRTTAATARGP